MACDSPSWFRQNPVALIHFSLVSQKTKLVTDDRNYIRSRFRFGINSVDLFSLHVYHTCHQKVVVSDRAAFSLRWDQSQSGGSSWLKLHHSEFDETRKDGEHDAAAAVSPHAGVYRHDFCLFCSIVNSTRRHSLRLQDSHVRS